MRIVITKFSNWSPEAYLNSQHPEYVAIRKIINQNPEHNFVLVGEGQKFSHFKINGVQFYNLNSSSKIGYFLSVFIELGLAVLIKPSVIIGLGFLNLIPFRLATLAAKSRFISVVTGEIRYGTDSLPKPFRRFFSYLLRATFQSSVAVLAISEGIRRELVFEYGLKPEKVFVCRYMISKIFNPNVSKSLKSALNPYGPIVLTLCRISRVKGLEFLIQASKLIVKKFPDVKIIIKGFSTDKRYMEELRKLVRENGLNDTVKFLGFSVYSEVPKFLSASDVFVLPSLSEGLGMVLLEAMATGVPVVASRVGGVLDILKDEYSGLLVPPGRPDLLADAILRILSDHELRQRLIKNGLEAAQYADKNEIGNLISKLVFDGAL